MEECGARTAHWASSQWYRPVSGTVSVARLWHLGVSDCNAYYGLYDADLHEMEIAIRGVNTDCEVYGTLQLRRRATERLRDTSNDTSLSNTATKGL